jgi:hypothetical protein
VFGKVVDDSGNAVLHERIAEVEQVAQLLVRKRK